jgi:hypothetical protein
MNVAILDKPFEKKTGVACFAPYVSTSVTVLDKESRVFDSRIDSGADITCIPRFAIKDIEPLLLGNPITVRGHDGNVSKVWTYKATIKLHGYPGDGVKTYNPERGILLTDSHIGLIGMDILRNFNLMIDGVRSVFTVQIVEEKVSCYDT